MIKKVFKVLLLIFALAINCSCTASQKPPEKYSFILKEPAFKQFNYFFNEGNKHYIKNDLEQSVLFYQYALWAKPSYKSQVYIQLANCYYKMEDYDKALVYYFYLLKKYPQKSKLWSNIGLVFYEKGIYSLANAFLSQSISLNSKNITASEALKELSNIKYSYSSQSFGINSDSKEYKQYQDEGMYYFDLAQRESKTEHYSKAYKYFKKMTEISPDFKAYSFCGICQLKLHNYYNAIFYYSKAVELNPGVGEFYANMGYAMKKTNNKSAASELFATALYFDPQNSLALKEANN